jgi:hypothetical protein
MTSISINGRMTVTAVFTVAWVDCIKRDSRAIGFCTENHRGTKNNYYGDLTNTEKCVYLQMVRGFYGIPELAGASQSGRRSVFPAYYQAKAKK